MKQNEAVFVSGNIAIVQSQETKCLIHSSISTEELPESYKTVFLSVAKSEPVVADQFQDIKLLFGSWVESGEEDAQIEELYKSRLLPSAFSE